MVHEGLDQFQQSRDSTCVVVSPVVDVSEGAVTGLGRAVADVVKVGADDDPLIGQGRVAFSGNAAFRG